MKKDFAAFISDFNGVVSERLPQYIKSVYDFLFKPFEFISAIIRRDKAYFGIKSPSKELAQAFNGFGYYFTIGIQEAKIKKCERAFAPYEIKGEIHAPEFKPLADVVRDFNYIKHEYEWEKEWFLI